MLCVSKKLIRKGVKRYIVYIVQQKSFCEQIRSSCFYCKMSLVEDFLLVYVTSLLIGTLFWRGENTDQRDRKYLWVTNLEKASIYAKPYSVQYATNSALKVVQLTPESWSRLLELFLESFQETNQQDFSRACSVDESGNLKRVSEEGPEETAYIQFLIYCTKELGVDAISYKPTEKNKEHHYEVIFPDKKHLTKTGNSVKNGRCQNVPSKKQQKRKSQGFSVTSPEKRHKGQTHQFGTKLTFGEESDNEEVSDNEEKTGENQVVRTLFSLF